MKKVLVRALSGLVYVGLVVGSLLAPAGWFDAFMTLIAVGAMVEMHRLSGAESTDTWATGAARILDIVATVAIVNLGMWSVLPWTLGVTVPLIAFYLPIRLILALYDRNDGTLAAAAWSVLSVVYVGGALSMLAALAGSVQWGAYMVLTLFILIWLNDTGAYCVGCLIGRHKLFERLSPNKTWEGFFGGFVFAVAAGIAAALLCPSLGMSVVGGAVLGAGVSIVATFGDLFESMMKRHRHLKDSGNVIPGHGGILDRIDSLLLVSVTIIPALVFIELLM